MPFCLIAVFAYVMSFSIYMGLLIIVCMSSLHTVYPKKGDNFNKFCGYQFSIDVYNVNMI
jgi:hypothetical protein